MQCSSWWAPTSTSRSTLSLTSREVAPEELEAFIRDHSIALSFETSAKENINVATAFEEIARQVFVGYLSKRRYSEIANPKTGLPGENWSPPEKKQCC